MMRVAIALLVAMILGAGAAGRLEAPLEAGSIEGMLDQQPQLPAGAVAQDDAEITSA